MTLTSERARELAKKRFAYSQAEITDALMAVIAWAGNVTAAHNALEAEGKRAPTVRTLTNWVNVEHAGEFLKLQEKYAEELEAQLAGQYRFAARRAVEVQLLALDEAKAKLEAGDDKDPSRTAANAATVADKMTGKLLALTGRPTSIREDRNVNEILRSLAARGVVQLPEADVTEESSGHGLPEGPSDQS